MSDSEKNPFLFANPAELQDSMQRILKIQNNNLNTMKKLQALAFENIQQVALQQSEMISSMISQSSLITKDLSAAGKPEEKLVQNIDMIQKSYEDAIERAKEISALVKSANEKATKILKTTAESNLEDSGMANMQYYASKSK